MILQVWELKIGNPAPLFSTFVGCKIENFKFGSSRKGEKLPMLDQELRVRQQSEMACDPNLFEFCFGFFMHAF